MQAIAWRQLHGGNRMEATACRLPHAGYCMQAVHRPQCPHACNGATALTTIHLTPILHEPPRPAVYPHARLGALPSGAWLLGAGPAPLRSGSCSAWRQQPARDSLGSETGHSEMGWGTPACGQYQ
ncbi:hypothetical protein HaLaN_09354 [Haematococcus lacustris]|uniref:Uncharacterized protein n=1 Tax=Haematococcus lacustris TaxID=44745 RepID=A0A699YW81_HAELA|nr:hypothetical protein HaLaN_09354 [Haematococcus lacustris]